MFFSTKLTSRSRSSSSSVSSKSSVVFITLSLLIFVLLLPTLVFCNSDEVRALLEFKKGIHNDPHGNIITTWNATAVATDSDLDSCPTSFHGVVCDDASNSVVSIVLDSLNLSGEVKFSTLIGLKMLRNLSLKGNNFTGRLVPQLGSMSNLQYLDLSNNRFIGRIPDRIHDLWNLQHLNLSNNQFSGVILLEFGIFSNLELRNVEFVDLSLNKFSGKLPVDPLNVSSLGNTIRHLNLSNNLLGGKFLSNDTLSMFQNLMILDMGDNMIGGELPSFGSLSNLNVLRLHNNQLYGEIPGELLTSSIHLMELDLSGNGFSGSVRGINSTTLEILDLSSNRLTGSFPEFSTQSGLTTLRFSNNSLEGSLPSEWRQFSRLSKIDLSVNKFSGRIPSALFSLNLVDLNLSSNHFNGPIPFPESTVGELFAQPILAPLESLDLSDNLLEGHLSSDIKFFGGLRSLNLAKNSLSGHIPGSLVSIDGLESLDLSNNKFEGHLPDKLPSNLKALNLTYNNLSGTVPKSLRAFPPSSFHPGNEKLVIPGAQSSPEGSSDYFSGKDRHRGSKSSIKIAIILASVGAALMIAFVALAYYRSQKHGFHGNSKYNGTTAGRDVKVGRFIRPSLFKSHAGSQPSETSLSFSNTHLLTSNSGSLSGPVEHVTDITGGGSMAAASSTSYTKPNLADNPIVTSARKSPPGSPMSSSPRFFETSEQPITLDVYSPDRFAGELHFLDTSLAFTAEQLSRAPAEVLGRSSHGTLYKATLSGGQMLTVKWLRVGLVKNKKDFAKEVKKIGSMRHPNIVPVRAYYWGPREQERLILSDYINGDSLALHLYESTPRRYSLLSFSQRLRVAVDVARCLLFLHDRGICHGNLKPTNILLVSPDFTARVTDYGLHRLMMPAGIAEQILNLGALGYCAPELANSTKPTPSFKADVYAFGVILMELLTRRSAGDIISGQSGAVDLTDWVRSVIKKDGAWTV
ncbi:hypothetical protein RDABS01_005874 [Bienertia sinuspersici]